MILRKPYAFLIKHFRKINFLLLILVFYSYYKTNKLSGFVRNYSITGIYNHDIISVNNFINIFSVLALLFIILLSTILIILLKRKNKPIIGYLFVVILGFVEIILYIYTNNYFQSIKSFSVISSRLLKDLTFMATIPYYPILIILIIRSLGLDLKRFGFREDKEFIDTEEDREEVEVEVGFDKYKYLRKIKYYFRNIKYFVLEHRYQLLLIFFIVTLYAGYQVYKYFYIDNRVYHQGEYINSNYYKIKINNTYLTDKDFNGNIVSNNNMFFVVVDLNVKNTVGIKRTFDIEKLLLFINNDYYVPTIKYNNYFKDLGNVYDKKSINPNEEKEYILIYEVKKPDDNANFLLKYQDLSGKNRLGKLLDVKIKLLDISTFKDKDTKNITEDISIPLNLNNSYNFKIVSYSITDSFNYSYQVCTKDSTCPIRNSSMYANENEKFLVLKFSSDNKTQNEMVDFILNYAKIRYKIDGKEKIIDAKSKVKKYKGNYVYLTVPSEIENAKDIGLVFIVRTYRYNYNIIKGE